MAAIIAGGNCVGGIEDQGNVFLGTIPTVGISPREEESFDRSRTFDTGRDLSRDEEQGAVSGTRRRLLREAE